MTIGIAASGPRAGLAVFRALAAVERVASGAIGGFAVFAAIDEAGTLHRAETPRGGTGTLFLDGEVTGVEPPAVVAAAPMAALMSSGPDRPPPLDQFLPAEAGAGLVTGHRLPNATGITGRALNLDVLDALRRGDGARAAVESVLAADPLADAGIIAVDCRGSVFGANSVRVARRPDLGHARRERKGAVVQVLHNAIRPVAPLAALAAEIALDVMTGPAAPDGWVTVRAGTPVRAGPGNRVLVDECGVALAVETTDTRILDGRHNCAAIYLGARVVRGRRTLGSILFEPNVVVQNGCIETLSGQHEVRIGYAAKRL